MARPSFAAALAVLSLLITNPLAAQPKPKPTKKPAAAKPVAPAPARPAPAPEPPPADVKVVTAYTQAAQVFQNTTYVRGARQRVEFPGMVSIDQCDLQRNVMLNPAAKRYRVQSYATASPSAPAASPASPAAAQAPPRGGVVTLTTTLTDTLERQTMFGLEARRIKTVMTKQADAGACDKSSTRTELDTWYVDLPKVAMTCARPAAQPQPEPPPAPGECRDRIETRVAGDVTLGFPVKTVTIVSSGEGAEKSTTVTRVEVTALEITKLDPALFEVPADYVEASSSAELMPVVAAGTSTFQDAVFGSTADGTSQGAPKTAGVTRVGILEPVNKTDRTLNTRTLRDVLTAKFSKAPYEAIPLSGSSVAEAEADAKRLECDLVLLGEITEVKTSKPGKIGGLLKKASGGAPKDVHDVKVSYKMFAPGSAATPRASGDVKASSGGGFSVGSALRVAAFAGQMYMTMGMMGGGMMGGAGGFGQNPMSALSSLGSLGAGGGGFFDPRAMAIGSMSMNMATTGFASAGVSDTADGEIYRTLSEAFENVAKAVKK